MLIAAWPFPSPNGETAQVHDSSDSFPTATLALDNKGTAALGVFVARRRRKTGIARPPREVFSRGFGATRSSLAGCLRWNDWPTGPSSAVGLLNHARDVADDAVDGEIFRRVDSRDPLRLQSRRVLRRDDAADHHRQFGQSR